MEAELTKEIKRVFGKNFIGPDEIEKVYNKLGLVGPRSLKENIPNINFTIEDLDGLGETHILVLQIPFMASGKLCNVMELQKKMGKDPEISEPCFYNQDWYVNEIFVKQPLTFEWLLICKEPINESRGVLPATYIENTRKITLPPTITCAYVFFLYYFHTGGEILWERDYVWTCDKDDMGDQIYVGRYSDPQGLSKNGFSIHRHLTIKRNYGIVSITETK